MAKIGENDVNQERQYSTEIRFVRRYVRGDFLIIQKTSQYNRSAYTYDAKHNLMSPDEFRRYIAEKVRFVSDIQNDRRFINALYRGYSRDGWITDWLRKGFPG